MTVAMSSSVLMPLPMKAFAATNIRRAYLAATSIMANCFRKESMNPLYKLRSAMASMATDVNSPYLCALLKSSGRRSLRLQLSSGIYGRATQVASPALRCVPRLVPWLDE